MSHFRKFQTFQQTNGGTLINLDSYVVLDQPRADTGFTGN